MVFNRVWRVRSKISSSYIQASGFVVFSLKKEGSIQARISHHQTARLKNSSRGGVGRIAHPTSVAIDAIRRRIVVWAQPQIGNET